MDSESQGQYSVEQEKQLGYTNLIITSEMRTMSKEVLLSADLNVRKYLKQK